MACRIIERIAQSVRHVGNRKTDAARTRKCRIVDCVARPRDAALVTGSDDLFGLLAHDIRRFGLLVRPACS